MQEWQSTRSQKSALAAVQAVPLLHVLVSCLRLVVGAVRNKHAAGVVENRTRKSKLQAAWR